MGTTVRFALVDVFADRPLTGNPLALVPDADALSVPQMQAIAREFNQSETTFVVRPTRQAALWRLRSYTPTGVEVGGAGHNALGAWIWLDENGAAGSGAKRLLAQQIGDDVLPVEIHETGASGIRVVMEQSAPRFGRLVTDLDAIADALGIDADTIVGDPLPQVVSTGVDHLLIGLDTPDAVDRVSPNPPALKAILRRADAEGCYVYTLAAHAYARFFNPTVGIAEDPATGTAAGPLAALLATTDPSLHGTEIVIEQGNAIGRPSRLSVEVHADRVRLAGSGLVVGEGWLSV